MELSFPSRVFRRKLEQVAPPSHAATVAVGNFVGPIRVVDAQLNTGELPMGKGILLWLIGIPIPIILLLWIFGFLH
jgi:hypothetical protein